jgi:hypothetical protein
MGQPVSHGYPDWGRQASPTDIALIDISGQAIDGDTTLFEGYVGNTNYLNIWANPSVGDFMEITVDFYTDAAFTQFVMANLFTVDAGFILALGIPVSGPYCRVQAFPQTSPQNLTLKLVTGVVPHSRLSGGGLEPRLIGASQNIGAGLTVNYDAGTATPGLAVLSIDTSLATWTASLQDLSRTAAANTQLVVRSTVYPGPFLVALGGRIPRVAVTNTTGAAGTVDVRLVAVPKGFG